MIMIVFLIIGLLSYSINDKFIEVEEVRSRIRSGTVKSWFKVERIPTTFVYGNDSILSEVFKGETSLEVLYKLFK